MAVLARIATSILFVAAALPAVLAHYGNGNASNCASHEFWFSRKSCCVTRGGDSHNHGIPPRGNECPRQWYWHNSIGSCVPTQDHDQEPDCTHTSHGSGCKWSNDHGYCVPPTTTTSTTPPTTTTTLTPSGGFNHGHGNGHHRGRRSLANRDVSSCPKGLTACRIAGLTSDDFDCTDITTDLTACGGCPSQGEGQDCTAIEGAWNVQCSAGACEVLTCTAGYTRSLDGTSCVAL